MSWMPYADGIVSLLIKQSRVPLTALPAYDGIRDGADLCYNIVMRRDELSRCIKQHENNLQCADKHPWHIFQSTNLHEQWLVHWMREDFDRWGREGWKRLSTRDSAQELVRVVTESKTAGRSWTLILLLSEGVGGTKGVFPMSSLGSCQATLTSSHNVIVDVGGSGASVSTFPSSLRI